MTVNEIEKYYRMDESDYVNTLLPEAALSLTQIEHIQARAKVLIEKIRKKRLSQSGIDAFMFQYSLSSNEGIALMCLAEALLRIPDTTNRDNLIRDKLAQGEWQQHLGKSHSLFVNATTWALLLTGKIVEGNTATRTHEKSLTAALKRLISKGGEPIVRQAVASAMKILGRQFVMGRTIESAIKRAKEQEEKGYRYSYDMLGEAAYTELDAQKYLAAYQHAIETLSSKNQSQSPILNPGISVKLSALHPRFNISQQLRLKNELLPRVKALVLLAKKANIGLTIDAEEAHTLTITLDLIKEIIESDLLENWDGFGLAVQAYQKRAPAVIDYLSELLRVHDKKMTIRLVKGAYWDTEIKLAQVQGLSGYPVFTRKVTTDVNYIYCAKNLLAATDVIYPQFATHNAMTFSTIVELARDANVTQFEFQCLHGMGDALYDDVVSSKIEPYSCRIYAPVGSHEDLLAYLVRRLLENGANSSFVNRIIDEKLDMPTLLADPIEKLKQLDPKSHPQISLPKDIYIDRPNSQGVDLSNPAEFSPILSDIAQFVLIERTVKPTVVTKALGEQSQRFSPINRNIKLGSVFLATADDISQSLSRAHHATREWQKKSVLFRASALEKMARLLQAHANELYSLLVYEGGKTLDDAVSEVREAIDYCYYYALQAKKHFATPEILTGPTGEHNQLSLHGRGVIACISPWNFPLAIFLGQVTASLAAGNCVIAKPATQTVFIAAKAIELLHQAGFPEDVVQLLPGKGKEVGNAIMTDPRLAGVVFTGSSETARGINQQLAQRVGPILPLIAETGGQNAMIVDSSALPEQVTQDVLASAFRSAGQRCSALRVLFLQTEVADRIITMIKGAMAELSMGDPSMLSTDVGPMIDENAKSQLLFHVEKMKKLGTLLYEVPLPSTCENGSFFGPRLYEIESLDLLTEEVFGPILHIIRYQGDKLFEVVEQINRTGYGLTLGIHSRINETVDLICTNVHVGNVYVNRNIIGAVVGVQPFGGEGLSGTGPKAGGPFYVPRLATERTLSINTTASGGNASLMSLSENL